MASSVPKFSLSLGGLTSKSGQPTGGPSLFAVERSLQVPADGLRVLLADRRGVSPGNDASLELDAGDGLERVFTGTVVEVRPFSSGVEVFAAGKMLALLELRVSSFYEQQTAGDVARDLIDQAGLDAGDVSDGLSLPRFAVERRRSAFSQLRALARRLGFDLFSDREGKIHFKGLGAAANLGSGGLGGAGAALAGSLANALGGGETISWGKHQLSAEGAACSPAGRKVVVCGESPTSAQGDDKTYWLTAKDTDFEDSAGDGDETLVLDPVARTKDMAGRFAQGYLAGLDRRQRAVRLTFQGKPELELGDSLEAADAQEDLLNAQGVITALRHRFAAGLGFVTDATIAVESRG
jgi:hypothetical protein